MVTLGKVEVHAKRGKPMPEGWTIAADGTPGVSGRHCMLHWQNGSLMLTDLGSAYGTFLEDGRRLPAQYPMPVTPGDKFYVGSPNIVFQIQ